MSDVVWIKIARDPLGRDLVSAMSMGKHGTVFAGYAFDLPVEVWDELGDHQRYFEVIDEDDVSDREKAILKNNRSRNNAFFAEAKRNQQIRQQKQNARVVQAALAAAALPEMSDDFPDSDDD